MQLEEYCNGSLPIMKGQVNALITIFHFLSYALDTYKYLYACNINWLIKSVE